MRPIIEFCTNNMHHGTDEVMDKLEENPDYDVIEYGCLNNCGQCVMEPFALVNGKIIDAKTIDELYTKILKAIEDEEGEDPFAFLDDLD
ncbi:YuzB family protein [Marinicrinis lubricantis]|uniref:YuzB family protein n=1 Tax=Marinicrinis lubricantis TaxID=2086470 RepID=A0ABW1IUK0_9BACL